MALPEHKVPSAHKDPQAHGVSMAHKESTERTAQRVPLAQKDQPV